MKPIPFLAAAILAVAFPCAAQDLARVAGDAAKVILENDKVRVIELTIAPGTATGVHSHDDNIVYFLTASDATQTEADGSKRVRHFKPGDIMWSDPVTHDTVNEGKEPTRVLIIELKAPATKQAAGPA